MRSRQSNDSGHRAPLIYWSVVIIKSQDYDPVSSAQVLLTVSLQIEEAVKVSITRKAGDILFAFVFQIFIFNVSIYLYTASAPIPHLSFPEPAWDVEHSRS